MSWSKSVVENTLEFSDDFLRDLLEIANDIDYYRHNSDDTEEEILEDLREWLFHPDHMEGMGTWMYNEKAREIIKKHRLTGQIIFTEEDFGPSGMKFVDGELVSETLEMVFV